MTTHTAQATFLSTARYTLVVTLICYLPHFITAPWWLLAVVFTAITYRLIADYFGYPLLHLLTRVGLVTICFILLQSQYSSILSSGFFISFLLIFIALKIVEIHHMRDIKVLIFCNFYLIFSALLVIQELWIIIYLLIAILANLALMLKISAPKASLKQIGGKSTKQLLIAIPLSILLFYLFPRIANPLWSVPLVSQSHVGFSERMSPGSIADLFKDDSTAFRVTFNSKPILNGYWRGLILSFYNGVSWNPTWFSGNSPPLAELKSDASADYEIILEPHQKKWLFYTGTPVAGRPDLLFSSSLGLISNEKEIITDRFAYALKIQNQPGYNPLKPEEVTKYTQLPRTFNPRLKQWANAEYVKVNKDPKAFIRFLSHYINQQSFWYTLSPPAANSRNQMDYFWFDSQRGFCEHYASAVTLILRNVGIASRIVVGYQGGEWNPMAQYLNIAQNDAHAWLEYWQAGAGWQQFDPTAFIASERVEDDIRELRNGRLNQSEYATNGMSWLLKTRLYLDSARFFAERWLLFYNQDAQAELLQKAGFGNWDIMQLLQAIIACFILFIIFLSIYYQWWQKRHYDPLLIEYHLLQKEFRRFNVSTHPSATLKQQCEALVNKAPALASMIHRFLFRYELLRLQQHNTNRATKKETLLMFKTLRHTLNKTKPSREKKL